ncbi:MAG: alpha/beta hydrolase [Alphaproteobacteria bacterium]|nr:alpha/beta hydrolase [Alphaproteobacteria bacterium]
MSEPPAPGPPVFGAYDQAGLDLQFNNRARVPDFATYLARFPAASSRARALIGSEIDLAYGPGPRDRLDLFRPPAPKGKPPVLAFIHGGYWQGLDKSHFSYLARPWVRAGAAVVTLGYPICPAVTMTRLVASVRAGIAWIAAESPRLGLDGRRIVVAGHSAGGHLTAMAMTGPGPDLAGGIALSGLYDLEPIRLSYLNAALGMGAEEARRLSPVHLPRPRSGRLVLAVGGAESEEYHRQQDTLSAAWDVEARALAGLNHFSIVDALADPSNPLFLTAAELLGL